eukprot:scaffold1632_cov63-Phaeocystis_antarctica.AAC.9
MGSRLSRLAACASSRLCERHEVRGMSKVSGHARQTRERSAFGRVPLVLSVSLPQHEENVNLKEFGTSGRCARQAEPATVKIYGPRAHRGARPPARIFHFSCAIFSMGYILVIDYVRMSIVARKHILMDSITLRLTRLRCTPDLKHPPGRAPLPLLRRPETATAGVRCTDARMR